VDQPRLDELIDKYAFGLLATEEWEELVEWYRSAEIGAVEWPSDELNERDHLYQRMLDRLQMETKPIPQKIFHLRAWHVAASLVIIFSTLWIARRYLNVTPGPAFTTARNPSGKIQAILLPDSSRVWLNAASSVRYFQAFGKGPGGDREVYLEGEGFFDVVPNRDHPFVVHAGNLTTTVLGTRFDMKSFAGEALVTVTVIRGKVSVWDSVRELGMLTPARQLQLDTRTGRSAVAMVDTNQEIASSLGRWYNVRFVFANPLIRRCRYYLNFDNSISLQQLLAALRETTDLNFQVDDANHTVTVSGSGCQ
jgi:transmembrane sensor